MLLRDSPHKGTATYDVVLELAAGEAWATDKEGYRREFIELVKKRNKRSRPTAGTTCKSERRGGPSPPPNAE